MTLLDDLELLIGKPRASLDRVVDFLSIFANDGSQEVEALIAAASDEDNQCVPDPFAALTSAKNGKGAAAARRETRALYEAAVSEHGEVGVSVWLSYCLWHYHRAEFAEASNVHARALRALSPGLHAAFVEGYAGVAGAYA